MDEDRALLGEVRDLMKRQVELLGALRDESRQRDEERAAQVKSSLAMQAATFRFYRRVVFITVPAVIVALGFLYYSSR